MSVILEARNLLKIFGAFKANDGVSVKFQEGRIHAIIGENGAGKSTLMKMLFGLYRPDGGEIFLGRKSVQWRSALDAISNGIGMVQQHFSIVDEISAIDNIILGAEPVKGGVLQRELAIEGLEKNLPSPKLRIPWHEKTENLSVGEKQRLEILKLIYRRAKILILDEPTAVLTPQEVDDLFEVLRGMKKSGHTIIIISHKLNELFSICDDYTVLRTGKVTATGEIQSTTKEKIVEAMIGAPLPATKESRTSRRSEMALRCENVADEKTSRGALKGVSLEVFQGEIVGIAGVEGAGQRSLVQSIMGLKKSSGKIEVLGKSSKNTFETRKLGVGLIPEDRMSEGLWSYESGFHNMIIGLENEFTKNGFIDEAKINSVTTEWAKSFDVRGSSLEIPAGAFSGGNQQKLIFAREVAGRKPKFLICYQPTRGVDLGAVHHIHQTLLSLRNAGLAILLISSDLDEILSLSDRAYVFFEGQVTGQFQRNEFDRHRIGQAMTGLT